jgi:GNAT superfamily N-acetyltransferase
MIARKTSVKFLLSDGKHFGEKVRSFPLAEELTSSGLLVVGTKNDDTVVAACGIRSVLNILVLYVERDLRGHGVGAQVLRATIESAEKRKLHFITLSVSPNNAAALHLYLKAGFRQIVFLEKPQLVIMVLPLTLVGKLAQIFFRVASLLPNTLLAYAHTRLYKRSI